MRFALVPLFLLLASSAYAQDVSFADAPDEDAQDAIRQLHFYAFNIKAEWVTLVDGEPPYLFLMPIDQCGASDCTISGYEHSDKGWHKIYQVFGGDSIKVLTTKTEDHSDIEQYESHGTNSYIIKTSHWHGQEYDKPEENTVRPNM